jgi:RNA polymerase sigma factor (TIGR02999 family)
MTTQSAHEVTDLLVKWSGGDKGALDELVPLIHEELRRRAHHYIERERPEHTLQTTALVNEAYLRLVNQAGVRWQDRAHFFAVSARVMRHILVDYARAKGYAKRGGGALRVTLDEAAGAHAGQEAAELLALDEAMKSLAEIYPRRSQVVEMRYFGGLNNEEVAEVLKVTSKTVERDWRYARAWLYEQLRRK